MLLLVDTATGQPMELLFDASSTFNSSTTHFSIAHPDTACRVDWYWFRIIDINAINTHLITTV